MKLLKKNLQIAIDGPVGSGKSIGAHLLAKKLHILYVYTGAMYRAVAFLGLKHGLSLKQEQPLLKLLNSNKIELRKPSRKTRVCDILINNKDVTDQLFTTQIHWGSSQIAVFAKVRQTLVKLQKAIAKNQAVVMEGRDITTVVLPNADLKIYMTASLSIRAKRRLQDLLKSGEKITLNEVKKEIIKRDYQDKHRKADPLKIVPDAWILDTTNLSIDQEIELILQKLRQLNLIK